MIFDEADGRAVRYLLGQSSESEQLELEQELLADDRRFEEMLAIEDELMYAYLRGELGADDARRFEQRFLGSADGRARRDFARSFDSALAVRPVRITASPPWQFAAVPWLAAAAA